jgi:hypothetical protein
MTCFTVAGKNSKASRLTTNSTFWNPQAKDYIERGAHAFLLLSLFAFYHPSHWLLTG